MKYAVALFVAIALLPAAQLTNAGKAPLLIYKVAPEYTAEARKEGIEGDVLMRAVIGLDGKTHNEQVIKSLGRGLDNKAVECVRQWRFRPASKANGTTLAVRQNITVEFRFP